MRLKDTSRPARPVHSDMPTRAGVIRFSATLQRPSEDQGTRSKSWLAVILPGRASAKLPSRGMVSVQGTINGHALVASLHPDGRGGHWLKVDPALQAQCGVCEGDRVTLAIAPVEREPEPEVPEDLARALKQAPSAARQAWEDITPLARRDWVQWVTSGKRVDTRVSRIEKTCDMLAQGKRRPCCFDRSGMYSKSISSPVAGKSAARTDPARRPQRRS